MNLTFALSLRGAVALKQSSASNGIASEYTSLLAMTLVRYCNLARSLVSCSWVNGMYPTSS